MKSIRYSLPALRSLREHGDIAARLRQAIDRHAAGSQAGAATPLANSHARRLRVGDDRVIFEESETDLVVTMLGRRDDVFH
jgi:mRNA interferase RelE/StbE